LKELLTVCSQSPDEMREIEDMLSKSVVEDTSQDMHDNESEREELFITKSSDTNCRIPRSFLGLSTRSMAQKIKH
ncbi:hypothetical protein Tco_0948683, partial [Tanacetum coccineum]